LAETEEFDFEGVFGADYLYFYETMLTSELSDRQAAQIARLLDLKPGLRVLDVPCGHGRIAQRLAALGCRVVGVDQSQLFLEEARRAAAEAGVEVDYRLGDMRKLKFRAEFDRIVNVFTSFGYFDEATDRAVLRSWRRALRDGGRLLIEHQNRDRLAQMVLAGGGESHHFVERGDDLMVDRTRIDPARGRALTERILVRNGRVRRTRFSIRMFTSTELRDWLLEAGFSAVAAYDPDGAGFSLQSRRMLTVAEA
jgi:SAM-dependent methyltransferase